MPNPKEPEPDLARCEETVEQLSEENALLRQSSQTFGDLAERLNAGHRALTGLAREQPPRLPGKGVPDKG
jgi:hypothetical protein